MKNLHKIQNNNGIPLWAKKLYCAWAIVNGLSLKFYYFPAIDACSTISNASYAHSEDYWIRLGWKKHMDLIDLENHDFKNLIIIK